MSSKFQGLWTNSLKKGRKPNNHQFKHRVGCGLDRFGIGLDPCLDWPRAYRIGPIYVFVYVAAWMEGDKKRKTRWAGSKWTAWLLGSVALQQCPLGSLTAWQVGHSLTLWPYNSCSLTACQRGLTTSAAWPPDSVALQQFVAWLLGRVNKRKAGKPKKHVINIIRPDINSPIYYIIPKVWINSLKVWIGGLDQRSGSFVGPELIPDLFERTWHILTCRLATKWPRPTPTSSLGVFFSTSINFAGSTFAWRSMVNSRSQPSLETLKPLNLLPLQR